MTDMDDSDFLPADPARGLTDVQLAAAMADADNGVFGFGMYSAAGAARLTVLCDQVASVLGAGLGRDVALLTLLGGMARMNRDAHPESSDTVVRGAIVSHLEYACDQAGVEPFTDDDLNEIPLLLALRNMDGYRGGYQEGAATARTLTGH